MVNKPSESCNGSSLEEIGLPAQMQRKTERSSPDSDSRSSSSNKRKQLDDKLESTKVEMDQVMEENQRLKTHLERILKDYKTLEGRYMDMAGHEAKNPPLEEEQDELIALSLGRSSSAEKTKPDSRKTTVSNDDLDGHSAETLRLGLDCNFDAPKGTPPDHSPEHSVEEAKEDDKWPGKTTGDGGNDEILQPNPVKRARVSVKIRCDTPTMNDGCQWRKYGQKIAKGNPCPRAYYRCTVASSCPVRKQVQRCADDMSVLITTYEGKHNHPLPIAATAMASTTSAAASMLTSGSSTSATALSLSSAGLSGLNLYLSDSARSKPFYIPNSSISASPSFPTITLDLTSSSSPHLQPRMPNAAAAPRFPTANLNFSSLDTSTLPLAWSDGVLSYGAHQQGNKDASANSMSFGAQTQDSLFSSYLQKPRQQPLWPDTIAAATKAITSDPNFQSALAAALTSIIGSGGSTAASSVMSQFPTGLVNGVKASEPFPVLMSSYPSSTSAGNKCSLSFLGKAPPSTAPFPVSKSNSPHESRDHTD